LGVEEEEATGLEVGSESFEVAEHPFLGVISVEEEDIDRMTEDELTGEAGEENDSVREVLDELRDPGPFINALGFDHFLVYRRLVDWLNCPDRAGG
jgi:hypothetical protein